MDKPPPAEQRRLARIYCPDLLARLEELEQEEEWVLAARREIMTELLEEFLWLLRH